MNLPDQFSFSQQNLQDYVDCKFRFLLKYVRGVVWPAVESEPVLLQEARMELGVQFHRLVQQYFAGIDQALLASTIQSTELSDWWQAFTSLKLNEFPGEKWAEKTLSIPFTDYRMIAKYDLLIQQADNVFIIFDWKTTTHPPSRARLLDRLQSIIYPYTLFSSLSHQYKDKLFDGNIEMVYWFPAHPADTIQFTYSAEQHADNQHYVMKLINEISSNKEEWFIKTHEEKMCTFCRYRSLCDRGISAGHLPDGDDPFAAESFFEIDFDAL